MRACLPASSCPHRLHCSPDDLDLPGALSQCGLSKATSLRGRCMHMTTEACSLTVKCICFFSFLQLVEGACCTQGQPLYSGSQFRPVLTNFLDFTRIPSTCSDGPCSGIRNGVGYNYKGTGLGSESQNPDSCCDTISLLEGRQTGGSLAWYNPPLNTTIVAGNKTTSWAFDLITGLSLAPVPGTGNPCNRSLPLTICNFDNVVRGCSLLESTEQIGLACHTPAQRSWHCCMQGHTARATIHYVLQGSQQHMCIKYVFHGAYKKTITVLL